MPVRCRTYGDQLFDLFEQYKPQYEYIAANAGVSSAELGQRLADSGARYSANQDAMEAEANRALERMGVNPNSGRYAAMKTGNALSKAAGYSMNDNVVREQARTEDMDERMQAAQLGLGVGNQGLGAYGQASNAYASAGQQLSNEKYKYDALNENARQFNVNANQNKVSQYAGLQNQFFGQASDRWKNGMVETLELTPGMGITDSKIRERLLMYTADDGSRWNTKYDSIGNVPSLSERESERRKSQRYTDALRRQQLESNRVAMDATRQQTANAEHSQWRDSWNDYAQFHGRGPTYCRESWQYPLCAGC